MSLIDDAVAGTPALMPKDNLVRADFAPDFELRDAGSGGEDPVLEGHFAVFNQWTEINSMWEGNFMERFAPGAFKKTIRDKGSSIRCLFQHGRDPQIGDKPLGPFSTLREDGDGVFYEVPLLDAPYVRETVLPGLRANLYGASFRFRVVREEVDKEPEPSEYNPTGLPERTVKEAELYEGGPVTFPAYAGASAGIRSISDEMLVARFTRDPERFEQLLKTLPDSDRAAIVAVLEEPGEPEAVSDQEGTQPERTEEQPEPEVTPAPSPDSAEPSAHPVSERRDPNKRVPIRGLRNTNRKGSGHIDPR